MLRRITDPDELNRAVNKPEIIPFVAKGYDYVDLSAFVAKPRNVALEQEGGVMIFAEATPNVFEGHYLFPKEVRGKQAQSIARAMISEVFTNHGAHAIYGDISRDNRAACVFTRALGFHVFWKSVDCDAAPRVRYFMTREEWASLFQV